MQPTNLHLFGHIRLSKLLLHHDCGAFTQSACKINIFMLIYAYTPAFNEGFVWSFCHMQHCLRVHEPLMKTKRVAGAHLRTATPADGERSEKYILIRSLVIKMYIWIRSSYIWMSVNYIHFGSYFSMFWKVRSDMVVDVCIFRHGH